MSIIRVQKNSNYSVISNVHINDERLSWKATAILTYLLSKPDNWTIYVKQLAKAKKDGIKAVYSGIRELKELGYIEHVFIHGENGKIQHGEYIVHEEPMEVERPVNREPEPYAQKGDAVKVDTVKGTLLNTDNKQILKKNDNDVPPPPPDPAPEPRQEKDPSPQSFSQNDIEKEITSLVREGMVKDSTKKLIHRAILLHGFAFVKSAIEYTNDHSNGGTWQKYKAFLGKCIDKGWADGYASDPAMDSNGGIAKVEVEFSKMSDSVLRMLADAGNTVAQAELDRRK